jgi:hypothetical protein
MPRVHSVFASALTLTLLTAAAQSAAQTPPVVETAADARALGGLLPDIIEEVPKHLSVQNAQRRELLRFTTTHWNFGTGPLQIRGGGQEHACIVDGLATVCTFAMQEVLNASGQVVALHPAGVALFHPEHNHWHQSGVTEFAVRLTPGGAPVGSRRLKTTFCLIDYDWSDEILHGRNTKVYWDCGADLQGISVGYGDEYHHAIDGQGIDITGLAPGVYYLTQDADPEQHWLETNDTNNRSWAKFRLSRKGANPEVTVIETFGYPGNSSNR